MNANPFATVFSELWGMVLQHPSIVRDVKERNRIRFDDPADRDPLKQQVAAADLPELMLTAESSVANLQSTSSTSTVTRQYSWMVSTGDYRYTELLARVEWCVLVAMLGWRTRLTALTWKDKHFVKRVNLITGRAGVSDAKLNRGIVGWSAVLTVEVEMHFSTDDLTAELKGDS